MKTIKNCTLTAIVVVALSTACSAAGYFQVYNLTTAQAGTTATFIDSIVVDGTTTYNILRNGENVVTKITDAGGSNTSSVLTSNATWGGFSSSGVAGQLGADVTGGMIRFANFFDNAIQQIDTTTGTPSNYVSNAQLLSSLGLVAADFNVSATNAVNASGEVAFFNSDSGARQIAISTGPGSAATVADATALTSLTTNSLINGGMTFVGGDLYFGSNSSDSLYKWDTVGAGGGSLVLSQANIVAVTGETTAGFDDIFAAPDGLVYFYETTADSILAFNPTDPSGTLSEVIGAAALAAGPMAGTNVDMLAWFKGNIAWSGAATSGGQVPGFYAVPEPSSLALICMGGLIALRFRRR
ncbi:PEP-CTERM sorting domain-containing protein [Bythopirellula polymerisocia]|uniref:Ice-binding protein C-terminal domain-containing protein n=1 Tax=Bythopirellula polymerisocia TaxID=2528003 RepID=A0A5C6CT98_9BACT|nr:PEP-CTERM sorting domain-containing protein [Bythopirellula polymerisocia]TWU25969.1 hypothetical protein Pla144_31830 [Bythopirellula polymerisocia]